MLPTLHIPKPAWVDQACDHFAAMLEAAEKLAIFSLPFCTKGRMRNYAPVVALHCGWHQNATLQQRTTFSMSAHQQLRYTELGRPVLKEAQAFLHTLAHHMPQLAAHNADMLNTFRMGAYAMPTRTNSTPDIVFQSSLVAHTVDLTSVHMNAQKMVDIVRWRLHLLSALESSAGKLATYAIAGSVFLWSAHSPEDALLLHLALGTPEHKVFEIMNGSNIPNLTITVDPLQTHRTLSHRLGNTDIVPHPALEGCPLS